MTNDITASDAAINKIADLLTIDPEPNLRLRIYVIGGGCSGFEYGFGFDSKYDPNADAKYTMNIPATQNQQVEIVVDYMSLQYLKGAMVDYVENLQGAHFVVNNPNAKTTCGCGNSFAVE